jgi:hypothetical protein
MSFDADFDYTLAVTGITADVANAAAAATLASECRAKLEAATSYSAAVADKVAHCAAEEARLIADQTRGNAVLTEIAAVDALAANTKADLYAFYVLLGGSVQKANFMATLLFNHAGSFATAEITQLLADVTTPADQQTEVARVLYEGINFNSTNLQSIVSIFRYVG